VKFESGMKKLIESEAASIDLKEEEYEMLLSRVENQIQKKENSIFLKFYEKLFYIKSSFSFRNAAAIIAFGLILILIPASVNRYYRKPEGGLLSGNHRNKHSKDNSIVNGGQADAVYGGSNEFEKLPKKYTVEMARKNGDVVQSKYGVENIDHFYRFLKSIENMQKDRVRITSYTVEGDPIIKELAYDSAEIRITYDTTRDMFGPKEKKEYKTDKIISREGKGMIAYYFITDYKEEINLIYINKKQ
jgi:hypothetical protein